MSIKPHWCFILSPAFLGAFLALREWTFGLRAQGGVQH